MPEQLTFDWPVGVSLGAADFFVSDANARAYAMVTAPDSWPEGKLVITGAESCGKSHLARVFQAQTGARLIHATELTDNMAADAPVIVEDMNNLPPQREEAMFHLHNNLAMARQPLLMTARTPPARWSIALPDLASRMQATTPASIAEPDDDLLQVLIMKLFADRQIMPAPDLAPYLARRIERSYPAVTRVVARLDAAALAAKNPITRAFAARVLDNPVT